MFKWLVIKKNFCPYIRTYETQLPIEICISYLRSQNPRDICEFDFWFDDNKYYIMFKRLTNPWRASMKKTRYMPNSVYSMAICRHDSKTIVTVQFEYVMSTLVDAPWISYTYLDEFFKIKLDATKAWPVDD